MVYEWADYPCTNEYTTFVLYVPSLLYGLIKTTSFQFSHFSVIGIQLSKNTLDNFKLEYSKTFSSHNSIGKKMLSQAKADNLNWLKIWNCQRTFPRLSAVTLQPFGLRLSCYWLHSHNTTNTGKCKFTRIPGLTTICCGGGTKNLQYVVFFTASGKVVFLYTDCKNDHFKHTKTTNSSTHFYLKIKPKIYPKTNAKTLAQTKPPKTPTIHYQNPYHNFTSLFTR